MLKETNWQIQFLRILKISALAGVAQLVGVSCHRSKGHRFDSQLGLRPRFQVQSPAGMYMRRN